MSQAIEALPYIVAAGCLAVACRARANGGAALAVLVVVPIALLVLMMEASAGARSESHPDPDLGGEFDFRLFASARWWGLCLPLLVAGARLAHHLARRRDGATRPVAGVTTFVTRLHPRLCAERLHEAIDTSILGSITRSRSVRGRIAQDSLRVWRRSDASLALRAVVTASIDASGSGSAITCRWRLCHGDIVFLTVWHGFLLLVGLLLTAEGVRTLGHAAFRHDGFLVGGALVLALALYGLCLTRLAHRRARADARFLLDFLRDELLADEQGACSSPLPPRTSA